MQQTEALNGLQAFYTYCRARNLPFAFYRLPGEQSIKVVAQKQPVLKTLEPGAEHIYAQGFLFAPFVETEVYRKCLIQPDVFTTAEKLPTLNFAVEQAGMALFTRPQPRLKPMSKGNYKQYVKSIRKAIAKGRFKKVVAARVAKADRPEGFDAVAYYLQLCEAYPNAFVSLVFTQTYGLWIGASPEILLQANADGFKTYSLAGTKANSTWNAQTEWGHKEKEEQAIVTDYIRKAFESVAKGQATITGPETVQAGNLLHLRTTFVYDGIPYFNWQKIVENLHPTPAVAGLPKQEAIAYILKKEKSLRAFYSGYLGPVNLDEQTNLFVNLRCMEVLKNKLAVFVGCGVTAESNPAKEWKESKMKTQTLLGLLQSPKQKLKVSKNVSSLPPDENIEAGRSTDSGDLQTQGHP